MYEEKNAKECKKPLFTKIITKKKTLFIVECVLCALPVIYMLLLNPVLENLNFVSFGDSYGWYNLMSYFNGDGKDGLGMPICSEDIDNCLVHYIHDNENVSVNISGYMPIYNADCTGAGIGAFLSLLMYPFAIMWNPMENFKDYKKNPNLFKIQGALTITFMLHVCLKPENTFGELSIRKVLSQINVFIMMAYCYLRYKTIPKIGEPAIIVSAVAGIYQIAVSNLYWIF